MDHALPWGTELRDAVAELLLANEFAFAQEVEAAFVQSVLAHTHRRPGLDQGRAEQQQHTNGGEASAMT